MRIFSLFLLLGTLILQWFSIIPSWKLILVILCICLVISFIFKNKSKIADTVFISICAFFLGLLLSSYQAHQLINKRITPELEGKELLITGKINSIPSVRDDGVRFLFDVSSARSVDGPLKEINLSGIVRLGWFKHAEKIQSGELWQLKVKLKQPSGFMNPGKLV